MPIAGYLINQPLGLEGEPGTGYDYIVAQNGLYLRAESESITAMVQLSDTLVRGLAPLEPSFSLRHGRVPEQLWVAALAELRRNPGNERYVAIAWENGRHRLVVPSQTVSPSGVRYERVEGAVVELHSHGQMPAFFSGTDDRDEQGFKVFGVVGQGPRRLDPFGAVGKGPAGRRWKEEPDGSRWKKDIGGGLVLPGPYGELLSACFRLGVYGYFAPLEWGDIFGRDLSLCTTSPL